MNKFSRICLDILLRIFKAKIILSKKISPKLQLTNLSIADTDRILPSISSLNSWAKEWERSGDEDLLRAGSINNNEEVKLLYRKAASKFYFAQIFLTRDNIYKTKIENKITDSYKKYGILEGKSFEHVKIEHDQDQYVYGYYQRPLEKSDVPVVLILTHLGGVKELLDFMADFFIKEGFATLRVDLPGIGESPGKLPLDAQKICSKIITYLLEKPNIQRDKLASIGISLGAYWTMKTAAIDERIKLAIGISTPVIFGKHWSKFPNYLWMEFKKCFGTKDMASTKKIGTQLTLAGIMEKVDCPIILFHGKKDTVSHPDAVELLLHDIKAPVSLYVYPDTGHGCADKLYSDVMPTTIEKTKEIFELKA